MVDCDVKEGLGAAWQVKTIPPSADWCAANLRLSPEVEAGAGPLDLRERPYWRVVFDAFDDPQCESIVVKKSTQVGGTVALWAHLLFKAIHRPAPCMVVLPDQESAIEFRDRVYWNALENRQTARLVPPRREWNTRWIDLATMRCYLAWSGSAQKLRMRACQTVYLSEIDVFGSTPGSRGGNPNKAAAERTKSFFSRQLYRESSPTAEPSTIAKEYAETNQGRWLCPCPHCGRHQELRFLPFRSGQLAGRGGCAGFIDEHGQLKDPDESERDAHYVCIEGCRIEAHQINGMVERGVYADRNQDVDITGRATKPPLNRKSVGLYLWSIHSPTISLGEIVRQYVQQKRSGSLSDFWTNWIGLEFSSRRRMPTWEEFGKRMSMPYARGTIWPEAFFICTGCDCQLDRVKFVTVAFGDRCTMHLVDWGELWRDEEKEEPNGIKNDLQQLYDDVIRRSWPVYNGTNPYGRGRVHNKMIGIDSNHRTMDVHQFVKWCKSPFRVRAVRGDHQVAPSEKYRKRIVERNSRTGEPYPGGLEQWGLFVNAFKFDVLDRITHRPGQPGGFYLPRDILEIGKLVLQEIVNEPPVIEKDRSGRDRTVFKPRSDSIPVDYWDCVIYARACAEMVVDGLPGRPGWDASRWPK